MDYSALRAKISKERPDLDIDAVDKAYAFAAAAHEGQKRYSGEPYIMHPVGAADILLRMNPDLPALQACLLHDVTEDTDRTLEEIEKEFGKEVAGLVLGMEKLSVVKMRKSGSKSERWKNLFLAMAKDLRIVFVKLADRLHNMQTLEFVPEEKRGRIAKESIEVHAAIASRLGIYQIKSELEDLCFKYLMPEKYQALKGALADYQVRSEECMNFATSQVEQLLVRESVKVEKVSGRMKHLWSIHQKMLTYETNELSDIFDIFAVRVILPDLDKDGIEQVAHLYSTLGVLHNHYLPLQDRFRDYVAIPKPNGYRSLHTTVLELGEEVYDRPTEIQIRTMRMHKEAEMGVSSHWSYKERKKTHKIVNRERHFALHNALKKVNALAEEEPELSGIVKDWVECYQNMTPDDRALSEAILRENGISGEDIENIQKGRSQEHLMLRPDVDRQLAWLRGLADEGVDEENKIKAEINLFPDRIFVLTPKGDVLDLPRGATPVDFAYAVHTEVGNKMVHAKVNGNIVPLDYELRNGEMVEVGTRSNAKPNRYWLAIAKTASAKSKIKNWFNKQDKDSNVSAGRDMLNRQLQIIGKAALDDRYRLLKEYAGKKRSFQEREQILESIGMGITTVAQVVKTLFSQEVLQGGEEGRKPESVSEVHAESYADLELSGEVLVTGEEALPVVLSACCKPKPPVPIIGYVTRGRNIRVHRQSCRELAGLEGDRFVSAHWKQ